MIAGKLDDIDNKILAILQQDAGIEVARLAAIVNRTPGPIHERIRKLQELGYIKSTIAILDRELIGQPVLAVVQVKLKYQAKDLLRDFSEVVIQMPEVQFCLHVSGGWDFILHVTATTPQAYYVFLMEQICGQPNVQHVETSFVMNECKSYSAFRL